MRILVLADIHSNWPALSAIDESFDACLFVGDLVDYATDPVPCIEWVRRHADAAVRGNHDHAVAQRIASKLGGGMRRLAAATRPLHWQLLSAGDLKYLSRLPVTQRIALDGLTFQLVHATPRDPFDEYLRNDPDTWATRLEAVDADIVCVGHTHVQFQLDLGRLQVLNPGSVGQPRDGDPRAAYAIIDNGRIELKRVPYDISATLDQMARSGVDPESLKLAEACLTTGGQFGAGSLR